MSIFADTDLQNSRRECLCCWLPSSACSKEHKECLLAIIEQAALQPTQAYDDEVKSTAAFREAASHGNIEMMKILHGAGFAFSKGVMNQAVECGQLDTVKYLASIGCKGGVECMDSAAATGDLNMALYLKSIGCKTGKWTVTIACANNRIDMLKWLVNNGAQIRPSDRGGVQAALETGVLDENFMEQKFFELLS